MLDQAAIADRVCSLARSIGQPGFSGVLEKKLEDMLDAAPAKPAGESTEAE